MIADLTPWHIITGEYPPQMGGLGDYSQLLARGLSSAGIGVHIWAPTLIDGQTDQDEPGIILHRIAGCWSDRDFAKISAALDQFEGPRRISLQYAPNVFQHRGLNFGLARWLKSRKQAGDFVRAMFHEVTYIVKPGDRLPRRLLAFGQRRLAKRLLQSIDVVDLAIPHWETMLRPLDLRADRTYDWRPVPSNVPVVDDAAGVAALRAEISSQAAGVTRWIGSFGTFAGDVVRLLEAVVPRLLQAHPEAGFLLMGRGGENIAQAWQQAYPGLAHRVIATGARPLIEISRYLQICDLLLQPYPGGVCTKRGSMMAGLAHGAAIVTTRGDVTEPIWAETGAALIVDEGDAAALINQAESLLQDDGLRGTLSSHALALYRDRFDVRHLIESMKSTCVSLNPTELSRP
jgi:glycosyltransferase involved in cell wall biosynthesis